MVDDFDMDNIDKQVQAERSTNQNINVETLEKMVCALKKEIDELKKTS